MGPGLVFYTNHRSAQESHENAIRILVEEAKVNLCLRTSAVCLHGELIERMMSDFKKWQYSAEKQTTMDDAIKVRVEFLIICL